MFEEFIASLEQKQGELTYREAGLLAELETVRREVRALHTAVKALRMEAAPKPKPKPKPAPTPGAEIRARVFAYVQEHGSVTVTEVAKGVGISPDTARRSINHLRGDEEVRMAGVRPGGKARAPQVFAVMNGG